MHKALFIFAGANGSGKTTLFKSYRHVFGDLPFVNADEMLKDTIGSNDPTNSKFGQELANRKIEECFANEESFVFETVFSHESKIDLIKRAKHLGYTVSIYFCHLSDPSQNVLRVQHRVQNGGHDVPEGKIISRIPRTLENVKQAIQFVDDFYLYDNSYTKGHQLVAYKKPLSLVTSFPDTPGWAINLIKGAAPYLGQEERKSDAEPFSPDKPNASYRKCLRCGRPLRGKIRPSHGVCSICEPKLNR